MYLCLLVDFLLYNTPCPFEIGKGNKLFLCHNIIHILDEKIGGIFWQNDKYEKVDVYLNA